MKLHDQVTSLEISKRLKELGVKQESLFWYQISDSAPELVYEKTTTNYGIPVQEYYSAFTVAELGELIKGHEWDKELRGWPTVTVGGNWRVDLDDEGMLCSVQKEADARGKILIYLLENNLISL